MDPGTQQGFAMAAIGFAGTVAGLFFGWLRDRDKYRFDAKMTAQDAEITALKGQNATQAIQIAALTRQHDDCEKQQQDTIARLTQIEAALAQRK